jgi:hypothetical protein
MQDEVANYAQGFCAHPALLRHNEKMLLQTSSKYLKQIYKINSTQKYILITLI